MSSDSNKSTSIVSDNADAQRKEQQIFLKKFNEQFIIYKKLIKEKLEALRGDRLDAARNDECPVASNECLTLDNKVFIYNNFNLIIGLIFVVIAIIVYFASN